ncbi:hypothetical protein [Calothrix rhizosoleniae]|uniref:hypothetical protein n=1 Tax=Calothrix rhizosoleniae TaxID=888997 RepID=UPI000B49D2C0|nr:hypothetical protein [Calothrix rhizosoleniae]
MSDHINKNAAPCAGVAYPHNSFTREFNYTYKPMEESKFADRLEAVQEELESLKKSPEYRQMLQSGYAQRCDVSLADAIMAVQECFNEYYVNEVCLNSK